MQNSCLWITRWSVSSAVLTKFPIFTENYAVRKSCALPLPHHTASGRGRESSPVEKRPGYKKINNNQSTREANTKRKHPTTTQNKGLPHTQTTPHRSRRYQPQGERNRNRSAQKTARLTPPAPPGQGGVPEAGAGGQAASTADGCGAVSWSQPQGGLR